MRPRTTLLLIVASILTSSVGYAQSGLGGIPASWLSSTVTPVSSYSRPSAAVVDSLLDSLHVDLTIPSQAVHFGRAIVAHSVKFPGSGSWDTVATSSDTFRVWRAGVCVPGMTSIGLRLDSFRLNSGVRFFAYSRDLTRLSGAFDRRHVRSNLEFVPDELEDDSLVIELSMPLGQQLDSTTLSVASLAVGDNPIDNPNVDCSQEVMCQDDEWCLEKRSVVWIATPDGKGSGTGVIVNHNVSGYQDRLYILTALHNLYPDGTKKCHEMSETWQPQASDAAKMVVRTGAYTKTTPANGCYSAQELSAYGRRYAGLEIVASDRARDIALVRTIESVEANEGLYYSGIVTENETSTPPSGALTILSHPGGKTMQIARAKGARTTSITYTDRNNNTTTISQNSLAGGGGMCGNGPGFSFSADDETFTKAPTETHYGFVSAGSSGAPVYDSDHRVAGILSVLISADGINDDCPDATDGCPCDLGGDPIYAVAQAGFIPASFLQTLGFGAVASSDGRFQSPKLKRSVGEVLVRSVPNPLLVEGQFVATEDADIELSSKASIVLRPTTTGAIHLQSGSQVRAFIGFDCAYLGAEPDENASWDLKTVGPRHVIEHDNARESRMYFSSARPQPAWNVVAIDCLVRDGRVFELSLFDGRGEALGSVDTRTSMTPGSYSITIDVSELPTGTYLYTMRDGEYLETRRIVIAR